MKRNNSCIHKARLHSIWGLAFLMVAVACGEKNDKEKDIVENKVGIHWEGKKATALVIPQTELRDFSSDSVALWLQVQLAYSTEDMLGECEVRPGSVIFTPLVPFTSGFEYTVRWKGTFLERIKIPVDSTLEPPDVVAVYPSGDTIPANLLKMYILFTKPMAEGQAMEYIEVTKNKKTVVPGAFLDLEPELWNKDRTMLTVWLDPGRIKRDLQPNKRMGPPLEPGNRYVVSVNQGWEDTDGLLLRASSRMDFIAGARDEQSPDPATWTITPPVSQTQMPLVIEMHEPMDYGVIKDAVRILDFRGRPVHSEMTLEMGESILVFTPVRPWVSGYYSLEIEPRLEDLAGNNLERLFDKDLLKDTAAKKKVTTKRVFKIK